MARLGRGRNTYQPGDLLSDHVAVFVWSGANSGSLAVTSHFEKLSYSNCKRASGDELCTSCHDPHGEDPTADRELLFRGRCLTCHEKRPCSADLRLRAGTGDRCQTCRMPKGKVSDAEHSVYTDHSIPRNPETFVPGESKGQLIPFWRTLANPRDSALAHAVVALTEPSVRRVALDLLRAAYAKDPGDLPIVAQLAQFLDRMNQPTEAEALYRNVVASDPKNTAALINLGTLYAKEERFDEAADL